MYQLYNVTMTSLPIMWYATFDFEHEKDELTLQEKNQKNIHDNNSKVTSLITLVDVDEVAEEHSGKKFFLTSPDLYEIGILKTCFSYKLLLMFIAYALWHAFVIFMICVYALNTPAAHQTDGKDIGL